MKHFVLSPSSHGADCTDGWNSRCAPHNMKIYDAWKYQNQLADIRQCCVYTTLISFEYRSLAPQSQHIWSVWSVYTPYTRHGMCLKSLFTLLRFQCIPEDGCGYLIEKVPQAYGKPISQLHPPKQSKAFIGDKKNVALMLVGNAFLNWFWFKLMQGCSSCWQWQWQLNWAE